MPKLEITVFLCGAILMIYELVGSRVLGPYFGTSVFVWTSLIGIILGSLSLGYHIGGKAADRAPTVAKLSVIVFFAALGIIYTYLSKTWMLTFLQQYIPNPSLGSVLAAIILFTPASFFLGMVSPYAAKLKMETTHKLGATIGNLYALSTAGSITGTFAAGFLLIPSFGTNTLLILLSLALLLLSLTLSRELLQRLKIATVLGVLLVVVYSTASAQRLEKDGFMDLDTTYNRIWIVDTLENGTQQPIRIMGINGEYHSVMYLATDGLASEYTKYYHLVRHFNPTFQHALMIGGAGYSFPKDYLQTYPTATMDVVEIDPAVTVLARKYFALPTNDRLAIFHQDARVFLNQSITQYDAIFGDAFSSRYTVPYHLTTQEVVKKKYELLSEDGVVILNIISAFEGDVGKFLRAEYATYKSVFPQVYVFAAEHNKKATELQNILLVAHKSSKPINFETADEELQRMLGNVWKEEVSLDAPILTDDFAPVDQYMHFAL